jgi:hypothetical protein
MAKVNRIPIFVSMPCIGIVNPSYSMESPKGMTAELMSAVTIAIQGPRIKSHLFAFAGMNSSFVNIFTASAIGCSKPRGPALLGPIRSCMKAATLRSA